MISAAECAHEIQKSRLHALGEPSRRTLVLFRLGENGSVIPKAKGKAFHLTLKNNFCRGIKPARYRHSTIMVSPKRKSRKAETANLLLRLPPNCIERL